MIWGCSKRMTSKHVCRFFNADNFCIGCGRKHESKDPVRVFVSSRDYLDQFLLLSQREVEWLKREKD